MVKRVCVVWLMLVSVAFAGTSWIELVPDRPGPYEPGGSVDVDVVFHSMEDETIALRLLTLDFSATDSQLSLPRTFEFTLVPPLLGDYLYSFFEEMPKVDAIYTSANGPGYLLYLSHGYALTMGTISVGLPAEDGAYVFVGWRDRRDPVQAW